MGAQAVSTSPSISREARFGAVARGADAAAKSRGVLHRVDILAHERGFEHAVGDIDRVAGQRPLAPAARPAEAQFLGFEGLDGEQERAQDRQVRADFCR